MMDASRGVPVLVHRHEFFPLYRRGGALVVAVTNPFDFQAIDTLSGGEMVQPVVAVIQEGLSSDTWALAETIDGGLVLTSSVT